MTTPVNEERQGPRRRPGDLHRRELRRDRHTWRQEMAEDEDPYLPPSPADAEDEPETS